VEAPGAKPYAEEERIRETLRLLRLTPTGAPPVAVTPHPSESLKDVMTQGRALSLQKQYAEALPFFDRATQLDPANANAWLNLGMTLSILDRESEALPAFERAIMLDPTDLTAWVFKGMALSGLDRGAEAMAVIDRALALDPTDEDSLKAKELLISKREALEDALRLCDDTLPALPLLLKGWRMKAKTLRALGRLAEANEAERFTQELGGKESEADWTDYGEQLQALERAQAFYPDSAAIWRDKGLALIRLGRVEEALAAYERATTIDPTFAGAWNGQAFALRALGRTAEAEEAERRAKELGG
jgi:tetratricopeptide (TPR) repeat protein